MMGYVFTAAECVINWKMKLHDTIAFSTTEAKYMAAVKTSEEALWMEYWSRLFGIDECNLYTYFIPLLCPLLAIFNATWVSYVFTEIRSRAQIEEQERKSIKTRWL